MTTSIASRLAKLDACRTALDWANTQTDPQQAWQNCERGD